MLRYNPSRVAAASSRKLRFAALSENEAGGCNLRQLIEPRNRTP